MSLPLSNTSRDRKELSEESNVFWNKMLTFKKRFKDQEGRVKSIEKDLVKANMELSLVKKENSRLNEKLEEHKSSINKYQQILKDLVEVEDRYCKLLEEKKRADEELSLEKKLRLELLNKWDSEKLELQKSLQDELRILKEHAKSKENKLTNEYSKIIEGLRAEIDSANREVSQVDKKREKEISQVKADLSEAQREISRLKRQPIDQETTIVNVTEAQAKRSIYPTSDIGEVEIATSKSLEYIFKEQPLEGGGSRHYRGYEKVPRSTSGSHLVLQSERASHPRSINKPGGSCIENPNQQQDACPKDKERNALDVFKFPYPIPSKAHLKKRKLYSRSDDTI